MALVAPAIRLAGQVLRALSRVRGRYEFVRPSTLPLFDNSAKLVLILGALYFVFLTWGINVSALLASAGIVGLALSFGAQDALANISAACRFSRIAPIRSVTTSTWTPANVVK